MPLTDGLPEQAAALHCELVNMVDFHRGGVDSVLYNYGTGAALLASGAATVLAPFNSLWTAISSATAAFFVALTRALNVGSRWTWNIGLRDEYCKLIYKLNRVALLDKDRQLAAIDKVYEDMISLRGKSSRVPLGNDQGTVIS